MHDDNPTTAPETQEEVLQEGQDTEVAADAADAECEAPTEDAGTDAQG